MQTFTLAVPPGTYTVVATPAGEPQTVPGFCRAPGPVTVVDGQQVSVALSCNFP